MKKSLAIAALFLAGAPLAAETANEVLKELAATLREARSLSMGAKASYRCPEGLESLKGTTLASVLAALQKPDFEVGNKYSYFLSSPIPPDQKGGGHPEVTFHSNKSGLIEHVQCFYSK